ncbi:MAG: hydroxymethylbilane synthase [Gammaproteobacteria bacterium]|nr:hydroxymethylbilane synthase [Gammaproteobacteria bacterium]
MRELRIATRASDLAVVQARAVTSMLRTVAPGIETRLVIVESTGDRDRVSAVTALTEMGAFVRSVQAAVLDGRADLAVHSLKDLPTDRPEGLVIAAYPERRSPYDVLVGAPLDRLEEGAVVGTGSPRRVAQILALRPDLQTVELRGNVPTRIRRVHEGEVAAAVLAEAGLSRLGLTEAITQRFTVDEITPAPGQGVLAVETLADGPARMTVGAIDDPSLRRLVEAERLLLSATGAGCRSALGAFASNGERGLALVAFVEDELGPRRATVHGETPAAVVTAARKELGL